MPQGLIQALDTAREQLAEKYQPPPPPPPPPPDSEAPMQDLLMPCEPEGKENVSKVSVGNETQMDDDYVARASPVLGAHDRGTMSEAAEDQEVEVVVEEFERGLEDKQAPEAPVVATSSPDLLHDPVGALGSWWDSAVTAVASPLSNISKNSQR